MSSPFLNRVRQDMRLHGYSIRTEKTYLSWIKHYIRYHKLRHPEEMGPDEVKSFLTYLANERCVAVNTQKTALNALAFLYHKVLQQPLGDLDFKHTKQYRRLPVVLLPSEVQYIIANLDGRYRLIFSILYGSGLRITECLRLRVQDLDFNSCSLTVRDGKGGKDRKTLLSQSLIPALYKQIDLVRKIQRQDNAKGYGPSLPFAFTVRILRHSGIPAARLDVPLPFHNHLQSPKHRRFMQAPPSRLSSPQTPQTRSQSRWNYRQAY